jgi:bifunctional DNA-binding transcriptional regulator/antitoxin component of YhaV-PrlF toxin-antitoxin module
MANLIFTRKVVQVGGLMTVSLPKCWRDAHGVKKGDRIEIEVLSDTSLRILPLKDNQNGPGAASTETPTQYAPPSRTQEDTSDD